MGRLFPDVFSTIFTQCLLKVSDISLTSVIVLHKILFVIIPSLKIFLKCNLILFFVRDTPLYGTNIKTIKNEKAL